MTTGISMLSTHDNTRCSR